MQTQGKCAKCKVLWYWPGNTPKLRDAKCPECGSKLERTSSLLQGFRSANLHTFESKSAATL